LIINRNILSHGIPSFLQRKTKPVLILAQAYFFVIIFNMRLNGSGVKVGATRKGWLI